MEGAWGGGPTQTQTHSHHYHCVIRKEHELDIISNSGIYIHDGNLLILSTVFFSIYCLMYSNHQPHGVHMTRRPAL